MMYKTPVFRKHPEKESSIDMKLTRNLIVLLVLVIAVAGAVWTGLEDKESPVTSAAGCKGPVGPEIGQCAPNFVLATLDGKKVELYKTDGKPTVVNFWATWCPPCQDEMPHFQKAFDRYKDKVRFIMVNETSQERNPADVTSFLKKHGFTFPVAFDPVKNERTVGLDDYRIPGIPVTLAVGPDGKIIDKTVGEMTEGQIDRMIQEILDE
jgi:thiol-disulfide isomerase/thioredoxin